MRLVWVEATALLRVGNNGGCFLNKTPNPNVMYWKARGLELRYGSGSFYTGFMGFSTQVAQLVTKLEILVEQIKLKGGPEGRPPYNRTGKPLRDRHAWGKGEGRERKETQSTSRGDR